MINRKPENTELVIFDFDGTLVDSLHIWKHIDDVFFFSRGIDYTKDNLDFGGMGVTEAAIHIKELYNLPDKVETIKDEWMDIAKKMYIDKAPFKDYAQEFIVDVKNKDINTAIGTSNGQDVLKPFLSSKGLDNYIDYVLTSCEVGRGKPFPDLFLAIAEYFGVNPENTIVVEDTLEGVQAGKEAGMYVYAMHENSNIHKKEKIQEVSDEYIYSFKEIII